MSAMCLCGLLAAGIVGVPGRVLLPVAFGFMVVLLMMWIDPSATSWKTSASSCTQLAAVSSGGPSLRRCAVGSATGPQWRWRRSPWRPAADLLRELGEYVGDRLFDMALEPGWRDSAIHILPGTAGGIVGIAFTGLAVSVCAARQLACRSQPLWTREGLSALHGKGHFSSSACFSRV